MRPSEYNENMRFNDANSYFKKTFGHKMYKAAISLPVTCPNRDGTCGVGGCAFCSEGGSGEFATASSIPVKDQIDQAIGKLSSKVPADTGYIAYFQSFSNTYCEPSMLKAALDEAACHPKVEALSVATRPDCLPDGIINVLRDTACRIPLFVELGLQTSSDETAEWFGRGYKTEVYIDAVRKLRAVGVNVITHIIFGLKGEDKEQMIDSVRTAVAAGSDGVKFTCLYILRGTRAEEEWRSGNIDVLEMNEYFDIVEEAIALLPPDVVVHRITGDGPKKLLLAPLWTADKRKVINYINGRFG